MCLELPKQLNNAVKAAIDEINFLLAGQKEVRCRSRPNVTARDSLLMGQENAGSLFPWLDTRMSALNLGLQAMSTGTLSAAANLSPVRTD